MASGQFARLALASLFAFATGSCATIDSTPDAPSVAQSDRATAARSHPQILQQFGGAVEGPLATYVSSVGERVATAAGVPGQCTFSVVNTDVVNAFAVPGCYIYITRGLLAIMNSEDELASVLGHEVGHVVADHSARRQNTATMAGLGAILAGVLTGSGQIAQAAGQVGQLYALNYSRDQEFESDDLGVRYLNATGYNPYAAADMLRALGVNDELSARTSNRQTSAIPAWARTHPLSADRVTRATANANASGASRDNPPENTRAYLQAVNGMIYGDDPEQGFVNGRTFSHPGMRISFEAPQGASLTNTPQAVIVRGQNLQSQFSGGALQGSLEAYANNVLRQVIGQAPATQIEQARRSTINGLEAVSVLARAQTQQGQVLDVSVVAYRVGDRAYHFVSITPQGGMNVINPMTASFRQISAQEAAALRPRQISLATVGARDTAQSLANRMAFDDYRLERFLALNGLESASDLRAGQTVKLVTYAR
ncbi:MAG: M48 family metalloprotease [Terricaulis sp.]